jgi:hypothetical protein
MRFKISRRILCLITSCSLATAAIIGPRWASTMVRADDGDPQRADHMIQGMNEQFSEMADAVGGLSADQKPKLDALEASLAGKIKADPKATPATMRDAALGGFREILTPDQQKKFDALVGESQRRMAAILNSNHLKQIGLACIMYANDHKGTLPATQGELLETLEGKPDVFLAVRSKARAPDDFATMDAAKKADWVNKNSDVVYLAGGKNLNQLPAGTVIAYIKPESATLGNNFLLADGSVFQEDAATSQKIIAELKDGKNPPPSLNATPPLPPGPPK